jgi:hypothetical protein
MPDRGAFMSVNNSVAQFSGGVAASVAGLIVHQVPGGKLEHYGTLGFVVAGAIALTIGLMYPIHKMVMKKMAAGGMPHGMGHGAAGAGAGAQPQPAAASK